MKPSELDKLILATILVVSKDDDNLVKEGRYGCLQITQSRVDDLNAVMLANGAVFTPWKIEDCLIRERAINIYIHWVNHWTDVRAPLQQVSHELCTRLWFGGPWGYQHQYATQMWDKVRSMYIRITRINGYNLADGVRK